MMELQVRMLGGCSLEWNGRRVDDQKGRMKKVWLLLAYLIYNRKRTFGQDEFIGLLYSKGEGPVDPSVNLKSLFYRVRSTLSELHETAGRELILHKGGSYRWNPEPELWLDVEVFEQLCRKGDSEQDPEKQLTLYREALELYRGDFLPKLSMESWVVPISAYYHRIYLETMEKTLALLEERQQWDEMIRYCRQALTVEPSSEALYQAQMRALIAQGDRHAAQTLYINMSELLFDTYGVMPSEESRVLYREALRGEDTQFVDISSIREQLREPIAEKGAMLCEYDFFKKLYQAQARGVARTGDMVHLVLLTVSGKKELSKRSMDRAVENLKKQMVSGLRQGDVVTQCSATQLLAMLPLANYENSCAVGDRLVRAFYRQHPHAPVDLYVNVQPLEPIEEVRAAGDPSEDET